MARSQITPVTLSPDAGVSQGAGTAIAGLVAGGAYIAPPGVTVTSGVGTFASGWTGGSLVLIVQNTLTAVANLIIRGSGSGVTVAGTAQTSPYPSNAVFTQGSQGDFVFSMAASSAFEAVWVYTSDRFTQPDGNIYIDFTTGTTGTIFAYALTSPRLGGIVAA
jgi:hypothetical protein